jgi:hypothetical protein
LAGLVPSGTVVTRSMRYSMGFSFRSTGFSHFCHRLLRDLYDYRPWLILPLRGIDSNLKSLQRGHAVIYLFSELVIYNAHQKHDSHNKNSNVYLEPK